MRNIKNLLGGPAKLFILIVIVASLVWLVIDVAVAHPKEGMSLLGKPCSIDSPVVNSDGLQCFYYGTIGNNQKRNAIWIIPNLPATNSFELVDKSFYNSVTSSWNTYTSRDREVSFKYPTSFYVNGDPTQSTYSISLADGSPLISIDIYTTNGYVGTSTRINDIASDKSRVSTISEESVRFNGNKSILLKISAKTNIWNDDYYLLVDLGNRQAEIHVPRYNDDYYDFISDALLTTLNLK